MSTHYIAVLSHFYNYKQVFTSSLKNVSTPGISWCTLFCHSTWIAEHCCNKL